MHLDVWIDVGIDVLFLVLHALHLYEWVLILQKKRRAKKKNVLLLSSLCCIELLHILADEALYEMHLIDNPFIGFRLALKIIALLFYGVFIVTETVLYVKEKKEDKACEKDKEELGV